MPKQKLSGYQVTVRGDIMSYTKYANDPTFDPAEVWWSPVPTGPPPTQVSFPSAGNEDLMSQASPDASRVAYVRNNASLYSTEIDTLTETFIANATESLFGMRLRWKPDSTKIVYVDGTQFATTRNMIWTANPTSPPSATKIYDVGTGAVNWFGWSSDGTKIVFATLAKIKNMNPDGSSVTDLVTTGVTDPPLEVGRQSNIVCYINDSKEIRKMLIDGSGDTLLATIGANRWRVASHFLDWDGEHMAYVYDTSNGNGTTPSEVIVVATDGSGSFNTGVFINTKYTGNLGNTQVDTPHVFDGRFYFTESTDHFPDTGPDTFVSYLLDGTDRRVEDTGYIIINGFSEA